MALDKLPDPSPPLAPHSPDSAPINLAAPATLADIIKLISASSGAQSEQLATAFAEAMKRNAPKRKITVGEYDPRTPWHPVKSETLKLTRPCALNGFQLRAEQITNEDITLLNTIDRSGRYLDRFVEVILRDEGVDEMVDIRFKCRTVDQMNEVQRRCRDFTHLLQQIVDAQQAEEAEMTAMGMPQRRRTSGDTKAFREATARREAREKREAAAPEPPAA